VGTEAFLDTAFAIALSSSGDDLHRVALALADELERSPTRIVTTRAVLMEIGKALTSDDHFRQAGFNALMRK
jgi:predicted nucleic acid-binding protein